MNLKVIDLSFMPKIDNNMEGRGCEMEEETRDRIRSEAHSKLILTGEHSVVYGYPAIAVPFPLKVYMDIWKEIGEARVISSLYTGSFHKAPKEWKGMMVVVEEIHKCFNKPLKDIVIQVQSDIPQGKGLGSSAAIAMSLVKGLFSFYKKDLTNEMLFYFVGLAESFAHGKPSGVDMMAVFYDTPIYFKKEEGVHSLFGFNDLYLVVADSGIEGDTKNAVEQVRHRYENSEETIGEIINRIGKITLEIREAMKHSDSKAMGRLMNENHDCLKELGVSNEVLDRLVEKALKTGALGSKLTGGGLGGCIIALIDSKDGARQVMEELMEEGASVSWYFSLENYEIIDSMHSF